MAVFTPVSLADLSNWISQFPLGQAHAIRGISSGIENSNFFIDTDRGEYVLTIFENLSFDEVPFYLHLMDHLAKHAIPVPAPVTNQDGKLFSALHGKPAAIVSKLAGASELHPTPQHCAAVGAMLARMHLAGRDFDLHQENLRGLAWWTATAPEVLPYLNPDQQQLLTSELSYQQAYAATPGYAQLPRGPIHADLFRNNVMFSDGRLTGFFDFYFAGCDTWIFDLAVTCNDWCVDLTTGEADARRTQALLDAYQEIRPLTQAENDSWSVLLRAAALRFWLSRLFDFYQPRAAEMLVPHDPGHFEKILRNRRR